MGLFSKKVRCDWCDRKIKADEALRRDEGVFCSTNCYMAKTGRPAPPSPAKSDGGSSRRTSTGDGGDVLLDLSLDAVADALRELGFTCTVNKETATVVSKHDKFWNALVRVSQQHEEINLVSYFDTKSSVNRLDFLEAINLGNRKCTLTSFRVDGDGELYSNRCLCCRGGFYRHQLSQLVREGNKEMTSVLVEHLKPFVD